MKLFGEKNKFFLGARDIPAHSILSHRQPQPILQPPHVGFIAFSLFAAFILNLLPWGTAYWVPDFIALVLVFWNTHQPRIVGIGIAWLCGVLMDVHAAGVLGEHALAYTLLSYGAITLHRRVLWFPLPVQALHLLPLFLLAQVVVFLVRFWTQGVTTTPDYFLSSVVATLSWPLLSAVLLAPQRRAVDTDYNRPL